jgi:hypothetical protein
VFPRDPDNEHPHDLFVIDHVVGLWVIMLCCFICIVFFVCVGAQEGQSASFVDLNKAFMGRAIVSSTWADLLLLLADRRLGQIASLSQHVILAPDLLAQRQSSALALETYAVQSKVWKCTVSICWAVDATPVQSLGHRASLTVPGHRA